MALFVVAMGTGADQILPRIRAPTSFGHNMVNGKGDIRPSTILASMPIAAKDVLAGENDLLERYSYKDRKPYDAGKRHTVPYRMEKLAVAGGDQFCLSEVQQDDCLSHVADGQRFVVIIEYEHLPAEPTIIDASVVVTTEDLSTSFRTPYSQILRVFLRQLSHILENIA